MGLREGPVSSSCLSVAGTCYECSDSFSVESSLMGAVVIVIHYSRLWDCSRTF